MRFAMWIGVLSLGLGLVVAPARAEQQTGTKTAPSPAASSAPKADTAKAADKGGSSESDASDKDAEKKPAGATGGYSWTDKPEALAKHSRHRWRPKKKIDPNTPIATYPGFRMNADGTSQVWVYVNKKVSVTAATTSGVPTFVLVGAYVSTRNNTNALVTTYFDTPLARARLHNDAAGAQLVLELREQVSVKHRVVDGPQGSMIVYVDLPKPSKDYGDTLELDRSSRRSKTGGVLPGRRGHRGRGGSRRGPSP